MEWDSGVWTRLAVFRDFGARFVGVQKCHGRSVVSREEVGEPGHVISFDINPRGTVIDHDDSNLPSGNSLANTQPPRRQIGPEKARKRTVDEIADSEGEDVDEYGWAEIDEDAFVIQNDLGNGPTANIQIQ